MLLTPRELAVRPGKQNLDLVVGKKEADGEGFEPPDPFGSLVFKTSAIGHSATHPDPPTDAGGHQEVHNKDPTDQCLGT